MIGGILGLLGVIITLVYSSKLSKDNRAFQERTHDENLNLRRELARKEYEDKIWLEKHSVLVTLIGSRYDFKSKEFIMAFNSVPAVFSESKEILELHRELHTYISNPSKDAGVTNEKLVLIFKKMFEHLGIEEHLVSEDFLRVFN